MNTRVQHLIKNPFEVQIDDVALLQDEIEKYPYFSTLRTLLLFGLKEFEHPTYQSELKKTSIYSPSRVALYHYLQKERQASTLLEEEIDADEELADIEIAEIVIDQETIETEETPTAEKIEIQEESHQKTEENTAKKPISSTEFTFSQWLNIETIDTEKTKTKTVEKEEKTPLSEKDIKFRLIDEFIEKAPKITPPSKDEIQKPSSAKAVSTHEYSDLMTETLAQIYWEQKMYEKAIRAYKILSLKYPEKSEFFEEKIAEINQQRNS